MAFKGVEELEIEVDQLKERIAELEEELLETQGDSAAFRATLDEIETLARI